MATAAVPVDEEASQQDCPVCHEVFTLPKVLPCGHLLCQHCLITWGQSHTQPHCPLCRCAILEAEKTRSREKLEDVVKGFPTDLGMEVLVQCQQLLKEDHSCQACLTQTATTMCLSCGDFFCAHCATSHKRMSVARNHVVEELSSLTPEKVAASRQSFCTEHSDEVSKVYCPSHGASVCLLCATTRHRQCPEVKSLEEKVGEGQAALEELETSLAAAESRIEQAIKQMDQHLHNTQAGLETAMAQIDAMCQRLESAVKACRQRLQDLLKTACSDVTEAVDDGKNTLLRRRGKLTTHKGVVRRVRGTAAPDAVNGMASSMQKRVSNLDCSATLPEDAKVISKVTLVIDPEAVSRVERELTELGQIKVVAADVIAQPAPLLFGFHDNHGAYIVLSNNQHTAERNNVAGKGIVLSADPMQVDKLYEVRVDLTEATWSYQNVCLGVVTQAPHTATVSGWSWNLTSAVVVVRHGWVRVNGVKTASSVGASLCNVREGGRVGLALDTKRNLHLYIDSKHIGVTAPAVADPCYFMVDLYTCWKKVTALPVQRVEVPV